MQGLSFLTAVAIPKKKGPTANGKIVKVNILSPFWFKPAL